MNDNDVIFVVVFGIIIIVVIITLIPRKNIIINLNPLLHELFCNFSWNRMLPIGNIMQ